MAENVKSFWFLDNVHEITCAKVTIKEEPQLLFYAEGIYNLSHIVDDSYNKLRKNIGNDFSSGQKEGGGRITELYSFHCGSCGYRNIHNVKVLTCGCGKQLPGTLVYQKIENTVIYDAREKGKAKRR